MMAQPNPDLPRAFGEGSYPVLCVAGKGSPKQNEGSFREGKGEKRKPPAERTAGAKARGRNWVKGHLSLAEGGSEII